MNCGNSKFVESSLLYVTLLLKGQLFYVYLCIWQFAWFLLSFIIYLKPKSFTEDASFVVFMFAALPISSLFPFLYFMVSMLLGKTFTFSRNCSDNFLLYHYVSESYDFHFNWKHHEQCEVCFIVAGLWSLIAYVHEEGVIQLE